MKGPRKTIGACLIGVFALVAVASAQDNRPRPAERGGFDFARSLPTMLFAQAELDDTPPAPPGGHRSMGSFENQRKHLEQLRMLKMLELLNLSDKQEIPFLTAFNAARQKHDELEKQTRDQVDKLADGIDAGTLSDKQIYALADQVSDGVRLQAQTIDEFLAKAKGMLTPEQYGKLVIFHMRFEVEMLEQLGRFREFRRQGGQGGQGGHGGRQGGG